MRISGIIAKQVLRFLFILVKLIHINIIMKPIEII